MRHRWKERLRMNSFYRLLWQARRKTFSGHQAQKGKVRSRSTPQWCFCCFTGGSRWNGTSWALIQAGSINLHLAQSQEIFPVWERNVHVATVHPSTLESRRHPCLDLLDHSAPETPAMQSGRFSGRIPCFHGVFGGRCRGPRTWGCRCRCFPESLRSGSRLHPAAPGLCRCWWCWRKRLCALCAGPAATRGWCRCWCGSRSHVPTCCRGSRRWRWPQPRTGTAWTARLFLAGPSSLLQAQPVRSLTAACCGIILLWDCWLSPVGAG